MKIKNNYARTAKRADALKLDPHEPMCPYMEFHNGQTCTKYVPVEKDNG